MLRCALEPFEHIDVSMAILDHLPHIRTHAEDADIIICTQLPWGTTDHSHIQSVLTSYSDNPNKTYVVFLLSDDSDPFTIPPNVLLFRTGMYRSYKQSNEHLLPYVWVKKELACSELLPFAPSFHMSRKPLIGFCGLLHPCRMNQITRIKSSSRVTSKIIMNTTYWGGAPGDINVIRPYLQNIMDTQFTLCGRGTGNFSARFYHVLAMGRIPIVVDTDMVFPLEDRIPWENIIVRCKEEDIVTATVAFRNTHDIVTAQRRCREVYDRYLAPEAWCGALATVIRDFIPGPS